jgi:tetratricopeptide (TPR) repeat protein
MSTRSRSLRAVGALLPLALLAGAFSTSAAQPQSPLRPGQSPGPRFVMSALKGEGDGPRLGFQVANAVRERIASEFDMRALWVVPESTITDYLIRAGYPADQPLSTTDNRQLARSFGAEELLNGVVTMTPGGGYRVQAAWSLSARDDMVQPLPAVEATKISDVAKLVAREFQTARKQVESVQRCVNLARARNYTGALAEARKAIDAYPRSVLGRVCIANIYDQQKLGADSMLRISNEILGLHPENARALAFAADAYGEKKMVDEQIRALEQLVRVEPSNRRARIVLINAYAGRDQLDRAKQLVDTLAAAEPDGESLALQLRVYLRLKEWAGALAIGERLIDADTSAATRDVFIRLIAAADAAGDAPKALDLATRAVGKFPTDDELVVLRVQYLRKTNQLPQARAVVDALIGRNPRAPNAWTQKARLEQELGLGPDTVLSTLALGVQNGEDRATVALTARSFGLAASKDTIANKLDPLRTALRYYKFAAATQAGDTTSLLIGSTSVLLAQRLAGEPAEAKRCELTKEMRSLTVDAQIELPKAGRINSKVPEMIGAASQLGAYADQLAKAACQRKD